MGMNQKKAIFVSGGGSGIGRAIAIYFAERGWFVGLGDIDVAGMKETTALIGNGFNFSQRLDVREPDGWDIALAAFSTAAGGRIDVLANNAGIPLGGVLSSNNADEITRCLDINLKGALFGAQAAYPHLQKTAPDSCLLNTSSAAGIYGTAGSSVYSASKFGVRAITEALDAEWFSDGIKVRSLMPSFIDTPLLKLSPNSATNEPIETMVKQAGLEITPVIEVAQAAWNAVHGETLHTKVGKTARQMAFGSRWTPGKIRKTMRATAPPAQQEP